MKKTMIVLISIALLVVWASGCSTKSDYEVYKEASERTKMAAKGKSELKMTMNMEFNKDGLSKEVSDGMEIFENISFEMRREYDRDKEESLMKIFVQAKDTGIDAKVYTKGDVAYIITPLIPKIVVLKGEELVHPGKVTSDLETMPALSQESIDSIIKVWQSLYTDDNVSALEKIVMDTPEGSVKATRYDLNMTDEQLKPAIKKTMEIAMRDRAFMSGIEDMMRASMEQYMDENIDKEEFASGDLSMEGLFTTNMDAVNNATIKEFSQTAYIDRDNYIIEERLSMEMLYHFIEAGTPRSYRMDMSIKNWDLNREQDIYLPEVNAENSITLDQLKEEYSDQLDFMKGETE